MPEWNHFMLMAPLLGGVLMVCACSGNGNRIPADTTASATASSTATDTSGPADSVVPTAAPTDTTPAQTQSAGVVQTPRQKPIRPSIDPGRKAPPVKPSTPPPTPTAAPSTPAADSSPGEATQDSPLKYDAASSTVTFQLIGGPTGFQFNGHASGSATLTVPPKANIVMNFVNKDGTPHSAEIISGEGALPNAAVDAAIPRAYTNQVLQGLPQEGSDVMRFQAPESGTYRIFCGVPGHGLSGMWIWMKVDPAAKTPSFGPTKK
jgi:hypothetical protein